ncbi:MAG: 6-pyruvoyl-tetrahydropterin synthase-related protein [Patescibacteria group bacterium]
MKKLSFNWFIWLILLIVSLLPLFDLFNSGLPITHDGKDHVARIANFYQSLSEGNFVPRWAGNLNWGYGHPVMMFLYPLPSYIASAFHVIGFSLVDSVKLVFAFGFIASVVSMYLFASYRFGYLAGILAALLYGFAPYRFVDMYVRGAIGEHMAFIFLPLVLLGLWQSSIVLIAMSMAFLLLSHNAVSLMMLPIIAVFVVYLLVFESKRKREFLFRSLTGLILGFVLSAFFWLPAYMEGKYTLRDIVTKGEFTSRFVNVADFFNPTWGYGTANEISKFLGFSNIFILLLALVLFHSMRKPSKVLIGGALLYTIVSLVLMTNVSAPVWQIVSLIQKFQFPWRFLHVTTFLIPIIGAVVVSHIDIKRRLKVVIVFSVIAIIGSFSMWHARDYVSMSDSNFTGMYNGTTDTGESSPIWSIRFMETKAKAPIEVISGKGVSIFVGPRRSTHHSYRVFSLESTKLVENTLYFPNWEVFVDKTPVPIEFQNPNYRGLLTFDVPAGDHAVDVVFTDTKLRILANWISIGGFMLTIGFLVTMRLWQKRT